MEERNLPTVGCMPGYDITGIRPMRTSLRRKEDQRMRKWGCVGSVN
jgi:hypothetical protein